MEAIVLAGGLGTRLKGVIGEMPKCMAPVNGQPFLHYLLLDLQGQGAEKVVLSLGYKHELVLDWLAQQKLPFSIDWVIEEQPLGTGGGIRLALEKIRGNSPLVFNGDTLFRIVPQQLLRFHEERQALCSLALKPMTDFDRYGVVVTDKQGRITAFREKQPCAEGDINGGIYCISKKDFLERTPEGAFSFEKDFLETQVQQGALYGLRCNDYFIDIGIPDDYRKAEEDFKTLFAGPLNPTSV